MIVKLYNSLRYYSAGFNPKATFSDLIEWSYEKKFCGVGTFELVLPAVHLDIDLNLNEFLVTDGEAFIIKRVQSDEEHITISGYDLNGILLDRITVAKSEDGKDRVSGSTETIVKHFVDANCVSSEDTQRNFPGLVIAEDLERGIADDAASPRFERVADIITDILSAQGMGWRISAVKSGSYSECMVFEVYNAATQATVGFSYNHANIKSIKSSQSNIDMKNTLYCELDDGTVQKYSNYEWGHSGFSRVEEYTDLGCGLSELSVYASHELAERYKAESSNTLENVDPSGYLLGQFDVGYRAQVYDDRLNMSYSPQTITAIKIKRSGGETELSVTLGETRTKPLDRAEKKAAAAVTACKGMSPAVKDGVASGAIGGGLGMIASGGYDWVGIVGGNGIRVEDYKPGYITIENTGPNSSTGVNHIAPGVKISVQDKYDKSTSYGVMELGNNVFTVKSSHTTNLAVDYMLELGGPVIRLRAPLFKVGTEISNSGVCTLYMGQSKTLKLELDKENQALHLRGIKRLYIEDTKVFDIENEG